MDPLVERVNDPVNESTSRLIQFYEKEYNDIKNEIERLKRSHPDRLPDKSSDSKIQLQQLISMIEKEKTERIKAEQTLSGLIKISSCNGELHGHLKAKTTIAETRRKDVELVIQQAQAENDHLKRVVKSVEDDVIALRIHSANRRLSVLSQFFPNTSFVEDTFVSLPFCLSSPRALITTLPPSFARGNRLYFLHRPPKCLPLPVFFPGHNAYWFHPPWILPESDKFELVVEGKPDEWTYFGYFSSSELQGHDMTMAEWISLDDESKNEYCRRIASQEDGESASMEQQLAAVKDRYDTYRSTVPCHALRCHGFDMDLYNALHAAAKATQAVGEDGAGISTASVKQRQQLQSQNIPPDPSPVVQLPKILETDDQKNLTPRRVLKNIQT